jgi:hypothetical protein
MDRQLPNHMAMPRLIGAPAYGRPPRPVSGSTPFDPEELPLEAYWTDDDRMVVERYLGQAWGYQAGLST